MHAVVVYPEPVRWGPGAESGVGTQAAVLEGDRQRPLEAAGHAEPGQWGFAGSHGPSLETSDPGTVWNCREQRPPPTTTCPLQGLTPPQVTANAKGHQRRNSLGVPGRGRGAGVRRGRAGALRYSHWRSFTSISSSRASSSATSTTQATSALLTLALSRNTCATAARFPKHGLSHDDLRGAG